MPSRKQRPAQSVPISFEFNGRKYTGTYVVEDGVITVSNGYRSVSTQTISYSSVDALAERLLAEIGPHEPG